MSRIPELTGCPSISSISFAIRSAIGTPRLRMPTMMRSCVPRFFSRISMAVLVGGIVIFLRGGLWYSLLFKKPWIRLMGIPEEKMKEGAGKGMPVLLLMAFLCGLLIAYVEAIIINHFPPYALWRGVFVG